MKAREQFGIRKLPYLFLRAGKGKIRGYSGNLSREELQNIINNLNVQTIGLYLFNEEGGELRISHDAASLLRAQITKSIIEIDKEQAEKWLYGENIPTKEKKQKIVVIKSDNNIIGVGKVSHGVIHNFVPKERRIR